MSDRMRNPRPSREIPRYDGGSPEARPQARPQQHHPTYDPNRRPRRNIVLPARWWVWLSIGIGLAVVANTLAGRG